MLDILDEIQQQYPHIKAAYATRRDSRLFEYYRRDVDDCMVLRLASADKSVVSALVGAALQQGFIQSVAQTIEDLAAWNKTANLARELRNITLRHLLTMTSGIQWPPPRSSFQPRYDDIRILEDLSLAAPPRQTFAYKPDAHLVACLLEEVSGLTLNQFAERYLFGPLGITRYAWNLTFQDYEGLSLTIRDFWKIGQLYLYQGVWDGIPLISPEYVSTSTSPLVPGGFPEHERYGYYWWVTSIAGQPLYYASGFGGQYLMVVPGHDIVMAVLSEMDRPHPENKALMLTKLEVLLTD